MEAKTYRVVNEEDTQLVLSQAFPDVRDLLRKLSESEFKQLESLCDFYVSLDYGFTSEEKEEIIFLISEEIMVPLSALIEAKSCEWEDGGWTYTV